MNKDIVEAELWDHYSELPNPMWYEYKETNNQVGDDKQSTTT